MICDGEKDERSNRDVLGDEGEGLRRGGRHGGNKTACPIDKKALLSERVK